MGILAHSEIYHGMLLQLWLGTLQHRVKILSRSKGGFYGKVKTVKARTQDDAIAKAKAWIDENGKQYYGYKA